MPEGRDDAPNGSGIRIGTMRGDAIAEAETDDITRKIFLLRAVRKWSRLRADESRGRARAPGRLPSEGIGYAFAQRGNTIGTWPTWMQRPM